MRRGQRSAVEKSHAAELHVAPIICTRYQKAETESGPLSHSFLPWNGLRWLDRLPYAPNSESPLLSTHQGNCNELLRKTGKNYEPLIFFRIAFFASSFVGSLLWFAGVTLRQIHLLWASEQFYGRMH
jgi:hypothetical protein